ncbi:MULTISPECIES: GNAT family N-acetyltransferase [unclassified Flavobacterium]|uniref:GNAT family N-acetyltransferase n=1 Tax=unclassified Flavobacterium TaxID=196869 RepID=UPI001F145394|nr:MULTISPECIES: GNAT family N-acetyltransferase [unclassified Flavobacterium]UMY66750.1 GNAT family N-acetyltransferase [Flavobacterium sp. HJ-32-4]
MITFRPIQKTDIPDVVRMMVDFYAIDGYPIDTAHSTKLWAQFVEKPDAGRAWLVSYNGITAGYLVLTFIFSFEYGGTVGIVDELYIKDVFRGHGIGKAAIAFAQEVAVDLGLRTLYLEVEPHNEVAIRLYRNAGFLEHKRASMRFPINTPSS